MLKPLSEKVQRYQRFQSLSGSIVYDGDGKRVKATVGGTTTVYIGDYAVPGDPSGDPNPGYFAYPRDFKWNDTTGTLTKYYYAGGDRMAMKTGNNTRYLLRDHPTLSLWTCLGSTTVSVAGVGSDPSLTLGTGLGELRYTAWGETRFEDGTTPTKRHYTGQVEESTLGIYFFNSRWYDVSIGRFLQADSIIPDPGNPQAWDRYAFVFNNPLKYSDPSGHSVEINCLWCDRIWIDYSNWSQKFKDLTEIGGTLGCFLIGCHVDYVNDTIAGPTTEEALTTGITSLNPVGVILGSESAALSNAGSLGDDLARGISNPVPDRLARTIPGDIAESATTLGPPGMSDVFVTAADDIAGITTSQNLAERLTLLDNTGNLLPGPYAILEFDTPNSGIASPIFRTNPGFVGMGRTAGGAREFVIPNFYIKVLKNLNIRMIE